MYTAPGKLVEEPVRVSVKPLVPPPVEPPVRPLVELLMKPSVQNVRSR